MTVPCQTATTGYGHNL